MIKSIMHSNNDFIQRIVTNYIYTGIPQFAMVICSMKTICKTKNHKSKMKFPCTLHVSHQTYEDKFVVALKTKFTE
jgi:hypothetical protein